MHGNNIENRTMYIFVLYLSIFICLIQFQNILLHRTTEKLPEMTPLPLSLLLGKLTLILNLTE